MAKTFEEENNELLEYMLNTAFYSRWKPETRTTKLIEMIEFNLTAACNQKCKYCYLTMHGKELYPINIRNEDTIINNLKLILDYYIKNDISTGRIDFFSGEVWGESLGNRALDAVYDAVKKGWHLTYIMIPSNMSFLLDKKKRLIIEDYIKKFHEIGVRLAFSGSIDGKLLEEENRPFNIEKNNQIKTMDEWYDFLFSWCKKYEYAFHPMVAANGIEKWKDNFDWWNRMFKKFHMDPIEYGMYLEVRNDDWTLDKITSYIDFLNHMVNFDFKNLYKNEKEQFMLYAIPKNHKAGYNPYMLLDNGVGWGCGIDKMIEVRLGDLAIGPCHRTCYEQFIYGKYKVENNEVTGVEAGNIQFANFMLMNNSNCMNKCNSCPIFRYCLRGCLGAQYEYTGEVLQPIDSNCNLQKAKSIFIYLKFLDLGIVDTLKSSKEYEYQQEMFKGFERKLLLLKKGEPKLWNYWETKIQNIIKQ